MIPLDVGDVARLTGGRLADGADETARVTGPVVIDSRRVEPGGLFVCVVGEHADGHDFAGQAIESGAVAVLAARPVGSPAVVVDDVATALAALATGVVSTAQCRVVGVTGSSGKTSTKDLLAAIFGPAGETVAPENSFNNELGLPLTALRITPTTETLVLEYSARGVGHIRYLCGVVAPSIAVVLNVGDAHLGEFGSREAIASAKGELVESLPADGVAVLNADDPLVAAMAARTSARVVTFGESSRADVRVTDVVVDEMARPRFRLVTADGEAPVSLALHGRHQAFNAAAATAAAISAGIPLTDAVAALERTTSISAHRMQLRPRPDGLLVLDDAYNANPESVRAALQALARLGAGRRTWAVLGPMRELGSGSLEMHRQVGAFAAEVGLDELVVVGADAMPIADGAEQAGSWSGRARRVADATAATAVLVAEAGAGDAVLVKASNSERLWRVADAVVAQMDRASA